MKDQIFIVTGAPGSGKTSTLDVLLRQTKSQAVYVDLDWLMQAASELAGNDVVTHRPSWKPFRQVWFELLDAIIKNGKTPVLFANINHRDVAELRLPDATNIRWALLDCDELELRKRVSGRPQMTESAIQDNLKDAKALQKEKFDLVIDTSVTDSHLVAKQIKHWIEKENA